MPTLPAFLTGRSSKPTVRAKGLFRKKFLLTYFPKAKDPGMVTMNMASLKDTRFVTTLVEDGHRLLAVPQNGGLDRVIADFNSKEEVDEALRLIAKSIAPSRMRWVWRFLVVAIIWILLQPVPQQQVAAASYSNPYSGVQQRPQAPQAASSLQTPQPALQTPQAPAQDAHEEDVFGMKTPPAGGAQSQ